MTPDTPRPSKPRRNGQSGFTLIETLVALTVLATAAVALLGAAEAHVGRIAGLERRAAATWTAENALAEAMLGLPGATQPGAMLGYDFDVGQERTATTDPDLTEVTAIVRNRSDQRDVIRMTGFVLKPATRGVE